LGNPNGPRSLPREARVVETVVFIQSQKVCQPSAECTLLDLAEKNGVQIPYGCRGAMRQVRNSSSERLRSNGRRSRSDS
jgi:hypothetical protein